MEENMNNYMYCPECGEEREIELREERESYPVKNEPTEIMAQVTYCKHCEEQIWNEELDDNNLKEAYKQYRIKHGLLQPEDIKSIREKYKLTQTAFAKILGFGEKTIARYETGSIQDSAQNNLMELANYPDVFELLLKKSVTFIPTSDYERAMGALAKYKPSLVVETKSFSYQTNQIKYKYKYKDNDENKYFGGLSSDKLKLG